MPAPIFEFSPISASPIYARWLTLTSSENLEFLTSTKFPILEPSPTSTLFRSLTKGPIIESLRTMDSSK